MKHVLGWRSERDESLWARAGDADGDVRREVSRASGHRFCAVWAGEMKRGAR